MVNTIGRCRLRYYGILQRKILREIGLKIHLFGLGYDGIKPPLYKHFDPTPWQVLHGGACYWHKIHAVDALEIEAWRVRPREKNPGDTTRAFEQALRDLDATNTIRGILKFTREVRKRFAAVPTDPDRPVLRIGLLGECSVLRDKFLNHNVEEVLGNLGAHVRNFFLMGAEIQNIMNFGLFNEHSRARQFKKAKGYLHATVGGHALDTVANAIRCHEEGYDGVVHLCPTECMPEVSVRPILRQVCSDRDFPLLELSFDEHTAHAGVCTRIEAFVDILWELRKRREKNPSNAKAQRGAEARRHGGARPPAEPGHADAACPEGSPYPTERGCPAPLRRDSHSSRLSLRSLRLGGLALKKVREQRA